MKLKLFARILTLAMLTSVLLSGCTGSDSDLPADSKNSNAKASVSRFEETEAEVMDVMDFDKKLELKKPEKPVNKSPNILFLGNSFTYANDLPGTFIELSVSGGYDAYYDELSDGGYHLSYFADPSDELGADFYEICSNYKLDYVILQEQSRLPTLEYDTNKEMYPAARILDETIKQAGGQSVFLMTWAYKDGDDLTEYGIDTVTTREEMQTQLAQSYMGIADELDALLSPAGIAFIRSADAYPEIELWDEDGMHPSPAGTYLAACTLYATVYDESPVGITYTAQLDEDTALKLQQIASETVLG